MEIVHERRDSPDRRGRGADTPPRQVFDAFGRRTLLQRGAGDRDDAPAARRGTGNRPAFRSAGRLYQ